MKSKIVLFLFAASGLVAVGAKAQVTVPSPAPVITSNAPSTANRVIYSPRLPSPTELSNVAGAQGVGIERIDQTDTQITVTYKTANGQLTTVSYQLIPASGPVTATTTVVSQAPTVVYTRPAPYYYYDDPFFYPWSGYGYGYSPVSIGLGFGYYGRGGYYGGGYGHGGYGRGHGHRR
ncbi:MAG: hypothetical protein JWM88_976 [Verrucomicrobia bacterium]|nr:hypothetical protein [Verrucomicrobiota bacterium]